MKKLLLPFLLLGLIKVNAQIIPSSYTTTTAIIDSTEWKIPRNQQIASMSHVDSLQDQVNKLQSQIMALKGAITRLNDLQTKSLNLIADLSKAILILNKPQRKK